MTDLEDNLERGRYKATVGQAGNTGYRAVIWIKPSIGSGGAALGNKVCHCPHNHPSYVLAQQCGELKVKSLARV